MDQQNFFDLIGNCLTQKNKEKLVSIGLELVILGLDFALGEVRSRYFDKHPDHKWIFDSTAIFVDKN
jgi:hypothetical protein